MHGLEEAVGLGEEVGGVERRGGIVHFTDKGLEVFVFVESFFGFEDVGEGSAFGGEGGGGSNSDKCVTGIDFVFEEVRDSAFEGSA